MLAKSIFKALLLLPIGAMIIGCTSNASDEPTPSSEKEMTVDYESVKPFKSFYISMEGHEGEIAYAVIDGDTVASTTESKSVVIPNVKAISRASEVNVIYSPITGGVSNPNQTNSEIFYVLMFEDNDGSGSDNDYNDLVLHIKQIQNQNSLGFQIQPVAMGNTKPLKLGVDLYVMDKATASTVLKKGRFYITEENSKTENVKKDFFGEDNDLSMINTYPNTNGMKFYGYCVTTSPRGFDLDNPESIITNGFNLGFLRAGAVNYEGYPIFVNWFIERANGMRLYAVPTWDKDNAKWENENGYPLGIIAAHLRTEAQLPANNKGAGGWDWLDFPQENVNIETVYPGFANWLKGGNAPDWLNPQGKYIPAIDNYGNQSLYQWVKK